MDTAGRDKSGDSELSDISSLERMARSAKSLVTPWIVGGAVLGAAAAGLDDLIAPLMNFVVQGPVYIGAGALAGALAGSSFHFNKKAAAASAAQDLQSHPWFTRAVKVSIENPNWAALAGACAMAGAFIYNTWDGFNESIAAVRPLVLPIAGAYTYSAATIAGRIFHPNTWRLPLHSLTYLVIAPFSLQKALPHLEEIVMMPTAPDIKAHRLLKLAEHYQNDPEQVYLAYAIHINALRLATQRPEQMAGHGDWIYRWLNVSGALIDSLIYAKHELLGVSLSDHPGINTVEGVTNFIDGNLRTAELHIQTAAQQAPEFDYLRLLLASFYAQLGNHERAEQHREEYLAMLFSNEGDHFTPIGESKNSVGLGPGIVLKLVEERSELEEDLANSDLLKKEGIFETGTGHIEDHRRGPIAWLDHLGLETFEQAAIYGRLNEWHIKSVLESLVELQQRREELISKGLVVTGPQSHSEEYYKEDVSKLFRFFAKGLSEIEKHYSAVASFLALFPSGVKTDTNSRNLFRSDIRPVKIDNGGLVWAPYCADFIYASEFTNSPADSSKLWSWFFNELAKARKDEVELLKRVSESEYAFHLAGVHYNLKLLAYRLRDWELQERSPRNINIAVFHHNTATSHAEQVDEGLYEFLATSPLALVVGPPVGQAS